MSFLTNTDFLIEVAKGEIEGHSVITVFGANASVGTSIVPIASSGTYQTPTTAQALEILSDNANDRSGGTGAITVTVQGVDVLGASISEDVTMNGITPVVLSLSFLRVFNVFVIESGTYASATAGSHLGTITLQGSGGGVIWAVINVTGGLGIGESKIGVFTVPTGFTAFLLGFAFSVDTNKAVDLFFLKRDKILDIVTPFSVMSMQGVLRSATNVGVLPKHSIASYEENTDIGFMATVPSGTSSVSIVMEILLIDNTVL